MARIRYICGGLNWPPKDGTSLRQFAILQALAKLGEVDMVSLSMSDVADLVPPAQWRDMCRQAVVQSEACDTRTRRNTRFGRLIGRVGELWGYPNKAWAIAPDELDPSVRAILDGKYDLTWVSKLSCSWRFGIRGGDTHILDMDDVRHREYFRQSGQGRHSRYRRLRLWMEGKAWQRAELDALDRFARVCVCSSLDVNYLGAPHVRAVHNGVRVSESEEFSHGQPGRMVFIGSMNYEPNVDGVLYFAREILPIILKMRPDAVLEIVGTNPTAEVRSLAAHGSIRVIGAVDEIAPYLRDAQISVVPLRMGSGTRLKIVEALAAKSPVVSTTIGAEGLSLENGVHLNIEDDAVGFANACVRLLDNPELRCRMATDGYRQVQSAYSWEAVAGQVAGVLQGVVPAS